MMIHCVHKALQSWYIQLPVGTCSHGKKDFHKHESKCMFHFLLPGVYKQGSAILKTYHKKALTIKTLPIIINNYSGDYRDARTLIGRELCHILL